MSGPRAVGAPKLTEEHFQRQIVHLAKVKGWKVMHVRRSKARHDQWATTTSIVGWPDLVIYHPDRGVHFAVELKSDTGRLSNDQVQVLADLNAAGLTALVWRPRDWDHLVDVLTFKEPPA